MTFRYRYRALTAAGAAIDGSIEADDRRTAQRLLRERGLTPLDLVGADAPAKTGISRRTLRRDDSTGLLRELHALLAGGVPAGEALGLISDSHQDSAHSQAAAAILAQLRTGEPLSAALRQVLPRLDPSVHAVVTAGEATGDLTEALGDAIVQLDADRVAREALRTALIYPVFLVIVGLAAIAFLVAVVVPNFAGMLRDRNADLPWISQIVIGGGMALREHALAICLVLLVLMSAVAATARKQAWRAWPILARWQNEQDQAAWCASMALLLRHRIDLAAALEAARLRVGSSLQQTRLLQAEARLRAGLPLSAALMESAAWPADLIALVAVGERSGRLPILLKGAADRLAFAQRERRARRLRLIEPAAILILGVIIGTIVLAVLLAVTAIGTLPL